MVTEEKTTSGVAWVALVISIVALILGWTAFNRAGVDVKDVVQREVQQATQEIEQEYQKAERATREEASDALIDLGTDISVDEDPNTSGE